jgi:hypothetical protein
VTRVQRPPDDEDRWPFYERRHDYLAGRIDRMTDDRLARMQRKIDELDAKIDVLSIRLFALIGALAVVSVLVNLLGPPILAYLTRALP